MKLRTPWWKLTVVVLSLAACNDDGPIAASADCRAAGPLACPVEPVDLTKSCEALRRCGLSRPGDTTLPSPIQFCGQAKLLDASLATVSIESNNPPMQATFLFLKTPTGWCPAANLLPPTWTHGGYCDSKVTLDSQTGSLQLESRRVCYLSLDQEELDAGESDIASRECLNHRVTKRDTVLTMADDGACQHE